MILITNKIHQLDVKNNSHALIGVWVWVRKVHIDKVKSPENVKPSTLFHYACNSERKGEFEKALGKFKTNNNSGSSGNTNSGTGNSKKSKNKKKNKKKKVKGVIKS